MKLIAIVAHDPDLAIGIDGKLPWHLPADLAFFKKTTSGHPIVMGRKTYESIGRPLPKRQNIVLTRDTSWSAEGVTVIHHPDELEGLDLIDDTVFIIGGGEIYREFLPRVSEMIVTRVLLSYDGDVFFADYEEEFLPEDTLETHDLFTITRWVRKRDLPIWRCENCGKKGRRGNKPEERMRRPICPACEKG